MYNIIESIDTSGNLKVYVIDVGQGDSLYIETPEHFSILIDSGSPKSNILEQLSKIKKFWDRKIDVLILTHGDLDHIGSADKIVDAYHVNHIFLNGVKSTTKIYENIIKKIIDESIPYSVAEKSMSLSTNAMQLNFIFPDLNYHVEKINTCLKIDKSSKKKTIKDCAQKIDFNQNTNSVVSILNFKNYSFMFTGDAPTEVEKYITKKFLASGFYQEQNGQHYFSSGEINTSVSLSVNQTSLNINANTEFKTCSRIQIPSRKSHVHILKLGHHGSKTSTSDELLSLLKPEFLIVSAGRNNAYGHPHKNVIEKIHSLLPSSTICTTQNGMLLFETDKD